MNISPVNPLPNRLNSRFASRVAQVGNYLRIGAVGAVLATSIWQTASAATNYSIQRWEASTETGLPQNTITAVVQTRDSYLWLGTYSGLARFDGVRFTVFDDGNTPGLASSRVTSLFEADDGTLWIGHETGELTRLRNGRFESVAVPATWSGGKIHDLATDEAGELWLLNANGLLARVRDGLVLTPEAGTAPNLVSLARSARGTIWVARNGRISVLNQGKLNPLKFREAADNTYVLGIGASRDGGLWLASDSRIRKWTGTNWGENRGAAPWGEVPVHRLIETSKGTIVAGGAERGFYFVFPNGGDKPLQFNRAEGFPSDWVVSLCEDREGNIWAGTGGAGLAVIRPASFQTITPPDAWQGRAVLSVCATRDSSLWIGTEGAGLYRFYEKHWTNFAESAGIPNPYVWSVAEDSRDGLWVGTWNGGLLQRRGDFFDRVAGTEEITTRMTAILCSPRGGLWVGTGLGLMRYEGGRVTWHAPGEKLGQNDVRSVAEEKDGAVWFGMSGGGLGCLRNGQLRQYRRADGLASDYVGCLRLEEDGTLWIGTLGGGLTRLKDGQFSVINRKQGLPNAYICHIEDDGRGFYWMSSHAGIIRVNKEDLNRCADGKLEQIFFRTFGLTDGLPTLKCSDGLQPAGCRTTDGRLWFSTSRGLVTVDPPSVPANVLPPPVVIEHLQVDDEIFSLVEGAPKNLKLPPGQHRFEISYTALSFIASERIQFKHRLKGLDQDWVGANAKRAVNYSYMPPGDYVFEVTACNNDGVWNQRGAQFAFTVMPFFWQTIWFRLGVGAVVIGAAGGVVWFLTRQRMRRELEQLERQRAIETERSRIAKDIHDDLGATLTRITMLSDPARGEMEEAVHAAGNIGRIHETARELTRSMDEIVWAINPQHDTLDSLVTYLEKYAQDYLGTAGISCRLDVPLQFPVVHLSAETRHNLFLAFKEALHNVVKHSQASQVRVTVDLNPVDFSLSVEDNGRGFNLAANRNSPSIDPLRLSAGNGLTNMRRRLEKIGGRCEIQSSPGLGAKIRFTVPAVMSLG